MPYPQNYNPTTSFASEETNQASGRSTVKTVKLDTELANISASINAVNSNLKLIQRDDGNLKDLIIRTYCLSEQVRALIAVKGSPKGLWKNATYYGVGDCVEFNSVAYLCHTAHLSTLNFEFALWTAISAGGDAVSSAQQASEAALTAIAAAESTEAIEASLSTTLTVLTNAIASIQESKISAENSAEIASNAAEIAQSAAAAGVGVNAQPLDQDLTAISALTGFGYAKRTSTGWVVHQNPELPNNYITQDMLSVDIGASATQAEVELGSEAGLRLFSPLRIKQAITAIASKVVLISTRTSAATITPNIDITTQLNITALGQATTILAPTGTPNDGKKLTIRIKDDGADRALSWTVSIGGYRAVGVTLPTTTKAGKVTYVGCIYNAQDNFWDVIAVSTQA